MRIAKLVHLLLWLVLLGPLAAEAPAQAPDLSESGARVQPGDRIALRIPREVEMSDTFTVAPNGEAVLPWLGPVQVTDHDAATLPAVLRRAYADYLRDPAVDVVVLRRIGVQGEVRRPDLYYVDLTMTLRDVLALAGGLAETANPDHIELVRGESRLRLQGDQPARLSTAQLRSGDHIVVGRRSWLARNLGTVVGTTSTIASLILTIVQLR